MMLSFIFVFDNIHSGVARGPVLAAQSAVHPTSDQGVARSILSGPATFLGEIVCEVFSVAILSLLLIQGGQLAVVSFLQKNVHRLTA